jgi:hypothetical protein
MPQPGRPSYGTLCFRIGPRSNRRGLQHDGHTSNACCSLVTAKEMQGRPRQQRVRSVVTPFITYLLMCTVVKVVTAEMRL